MEPFFEILPNETLLKVIKYLDAKSLLQATQVSQRWRDLCRKFEPVLWKKICLLTKRITGQYTEQTASTYATSYGWKKCFFWITSKDIQPFEKPQDLIDFVTENTDKIDYSSLSVYYHTFKKPNTDLNNNSLCIPPEKNEENEKGINKASLLKKMYLFAKGIETFSQSAVIYQHYADLLGDLPDINDSWQLALDLYDQATSLYEASLNNKDGESELSRLERAENSKSLLFTLYRYAAFLASQLQDIPAADKNYRKLMKLARGNSWILERYAEFIVERKSRFNFAERIYRLILNAVPSGSALSSFAFFCWQVRKNYALAFKCFKMASEFDRERVYFLTNFIGRYYKDEHLAKQLLLQSKLHQHVTSHPEDEQSLFALGLAFHQIHCVDEAEELYRRHMKLTQKLNVYTASNLAELLVHSRFAFEEAEQLYLKGLSYHGGCSETIELALAGLKLAQGKQAEGLHYLERLLSTRHIAVDRTAFTEGNILMYIHSNDPERKQKSLAIIKRKLVTENVRPKLIIMFDANLKWASEQQLPDHKWMTLLVAVYNCDTDITVLDQWEDWNSIEVPSPPVDVPVDEDEVRLLLAEDGEDQPAAQDNLGVAVDDEGDNEEDENDIVDLERVETDDEIDEEEEEEDRHANSAMNHAIMEF